MLRLFLIHGLLWFYLTLQSKVRGIVRELLLHWPRKTVQLSGKDGGESVEAIRTYDDGSCLRDFAHFLVFLHYLFYSSLGGTSWRDYWSWVVMKRRTTGNFVCLFLFFIIFFGGESRRWRVVVVGKPGKTRSKLGWCFVELGLSPSPSSAQHVIQQTIVVGLRILRVWTILLHKWQFVLSDSLSTGLSDSRLWCHFYA